MGQRRGSATTGEPAEHRGLVALCLLAMIAGVAIGLIGGAFRWCLDLATDLRGSVLDVAHAMGGPGWLLPVAMTAIGAALGALVVRWMPLAAGSGIQHVEAVNRGEAPAPPLRLLPAKFLGGLIAIGSGLVLGREGPTVHMGAVIGAEAGRRGKRSDADVRLLQTSIAGAGLAVAFNAPIGGALFVFEEVTKSFKARIVLPTLLAVAAAVGCSRLIMRDQPDFSVAAVASPELALFPAFVVFGLLTGLLGAGYNLLVVGSLDVVSRVRHVPAAVKAALIGALIGLVLFIDPLIAGGGDALAQLILDGRSFGVPLLLLFFALRLFAGPISYAAGTPGGLFAPLLAVGAVWGLLFASVVEWAVPGSDVGIAMALVGMAAFFGATVRAPFTGIVLVVEMSAITSVTVPMLAATGCAVLAAVLVRSVPIYDTLRVRMLGQPR